MNDRQDELIEHSFVVETECHGWRLDRFLMKKIRRLSRNRVQRVIRGDLDIDGIRITKPSTTVLTGQIVSFRRPAPVEPEVVRTIGVLSSDDSFYAIDKPAGLPIHPTARYHFGTLTAVLRERFPDEALQVCHRLDRETSGVLLVARDPTASSAIKRAFARRQVEKTYFAIVHGQLETEELIDAPLGLAGGRVRVQMAVRADGLPSRTRVVPISRRHGFTLVEAHPETGRQHQIRVHLAHLGFPIVGDKLYPNDEPFLAWAESGINDESSRRLLLPRHALHAARIRFPHPITGEPVTIESPLSDDIGAFLDGLPPA